MASVVLEERGVFDQVRRDLLLSLLLMLNAILIDPPGLYSLPGPFSGVQVQNKAAQLDKERYGG